MFEFEMYNVYLLNHFTMTFLVFANATLEHKSLLCLTLN